MRPTRDTHTRAGSSRGISDLVAFVLTFSIIITSVGLITTVGQDQLQSAQATQEIKNAERVFQLLDQQYDDLRRSRGTVRTSQLSVGLGAVSIRNRSTASVNVTGTPVERDVPLGQLQFVIDDAIITYEGGLVARGSGPRSTVQDGPALYCAGDTAIVAFVTVQGETPMSFNSGEVKLVTRHRETRVYYPNNRSTGSATGVVVDLDTGVNQAWQQALTGDGDWNKTGPDQYRCDSSRVFVRQTVLNVSATQ